MEAKFHIPPLVDSIEMAFDGLAMEADPNSDRSPHLQDLNKEYHNRNWSYVEDQALHLFLEESDVALKAYYLFIYVSVSEIQFDIRSRNQRMLLWKEIREWETCPFAVYVYCYLCALTHFYQCELREAKALFEESLSLARKLEYGRGQMRSLFHLGLVARDLNQLRTSRRYLMASRSWAMELGVSNYAHRVDEQLQDLGNSRLGTGTVSGSCERDLVDLMRKNKFNLARGFYLSLERKRRCVQESRAAHSHYALLPLIFQGLGQKARALKAFHFIEDKVMQMRTLELWDQWFGLSSDQFAKLAILRRLLGCEPAGLSCVGSHTVELCGVSLESVKDKDVRSLAKRLLTSRTNLTKQDIVQAVWGRDYDPITDDAKIYKLIYRTRNTFGHKDLIVNHYGEYSLHPSLIEEEFKEQLPHRDHSQSNERFVEFR